MHMSDHFAEDLGVSEIFQQRSGQFQFEHSCHQVRSILDSLTWDGAMQGGTFLVGHESTGLKNSFFCFSQAFRAALLRFALGSQVSSSAGYPFQ
jgi:hypothetical protein